MGLPIDLSGQEFGRLTAISYRRDPVTRTTFWLCRCQCGASKEVAFSSLRSGATRSCGCLHKEAGFAYRLKHGGKGTRLFRIWIGMRSRCRNPNEPGYSNYGGRGIYVCDEWDEFENFREWAEAAGYNDSLSIDRIDNDGPYSPENCRIADAKVQSRNRRSTKLTQLKADEIRASSDSATALAQRHGVSRATIRRIRAGEIWAAP